MAGRKGWLWYFDTACLLALHWKDLNEGAEMGCVRLWGGW